MASRQWSISPCEISTKFDSLKHSESLISGLNELRSCEKLLDITLYAEGESFKAHRIVLAACSDYFRAMFTDAMKEANESVIYLQGVTARGIKMIIDYAYTASIELNRHNVQDILSAATHVQMEAVVLACASYLGTQIDLDNCVDIATIADLYSLEKLKQNTFQFICSQLSEFDRCNEINRLTCDQFKNILQSNYPVDCSETAILHIVLQWCIEKDADSKTALTLFEQIRFCEIKHHDFDVCLLSCHKNYTSILQYAFSKQHKCQNNTIVTKLLTAKQLCDTNVDNNCNASSDTSLTTIDSFTDQVILTNSRGMELAMLKVGGFGVNGITNKITYYLPSRKKWHDLTIIPHVEQCNYGTAVLGNELYVVGGCYNVCLKEFIHPFGFRYCPTKNKWTTMAAMQNDRCRFTLNSIGPYLYAVGGAMEVGENEDGWIDDIQNSNSERYNSMTDTWEYMPMLPENRTQHAGATYNCFLYVSGGLDRHRVLSSLWCFNTYCDEWSKLAPMLRPRADHFMLSIGSKLYVCGGWQEEIITENRRLVETIDVYDINTNTWSLETRIPTPKYHAGVVAIDQTIYFIGGLHSNIIFDRASSSIQCYNLETKSWSSLERYPQNIWECTCVSLFVPKCREDLEVVPEKEEYS